MSQLGSKETVFFPFTPWQRTEARKVVLTLVLDTLHGVVDQGVLAALQSALQQGAVMLMLGRGCIGEGVQKAGKRVWGDMDRGTIIF